MNCELSMNELWIDYEWTMNWLQINFKNSNELGINYKLIISALQVNYEWTIHSLRMAYECIIKL
jgi:hypothetical protein